MSTRKRSKQNSPGSPAMSEADLPARKKKGLRHVSPPGSNISLHNFIYIMGFITVCVLAFYGWRLLSWKREVGGWWNLALGRRHPPMGRGSNGGSDDASQWIKGAGGSGVDEIESRINELAKALGMPSSDLASAIAGAVREYVPPASLSSISVQAKETGSGGSDVVEELIGEKEDDKSSEGGGVTGALGNLVGLDEPPDLGS